MRRTTRLAAACLLGLCFVGGRLAASPADLFGFGPRSQALAGTGASNQQGPPAAYVNPALLSSNPERSFMFGFQSSQFLLEVESETWTPQSQAGPDYLNQHHDDSDAVLFGLAAPLPLPQPIGDRLAFGLAAATPLRSIARVQILNESRPQFPFLGPRTEALNLSIGMGLRPLDGVHLGVGTLILASLAGSVDVDGGAQADPGDDESGMGTLRNVTDDELRLIAAPMFGVAITTRGDISLGAVYRTELRSKVDLKVTVENLGVLVIPPMHVNGLAQIDPAQLSGEVSYTPGDWQLTLGATHRQWSRLARFKGATTRCPSITDLASDAAEMDDAEGTGPDVECVDPEATDLGLSDTLTPRLAVERRVKITPSAEIALRAGYFYEPTPLPSGVRAHRIVDNARHVVSGGYEIALSAPFPEMRVALAVQWHHLSPKDVSVEIPQRRDIVGEALGEEPVTSIRDRLSSSGQIWNLAIAGEVKF